MKAKFDYVVVGCGMYGSTFARRVAEKGRRSLVVDQRPHIGGICYTEFLEQINVHRYGAHIFHTNCRKVWDFVRRFAEFNSYVHFVKVAYHDRVFSFPINLMTLHQLWGIVDPTRAVRQLEKVRVPCDNPRNLRDWALAQVGEELYEIFIRGYTAKQWNRDPRDLPVSIIQRIPIRLVYDDRYFDDAFQGIPVGGYTSLFERMLTHPNIDLQLNLDFLTDRRTLEAIAPRVIYTGKIDEFFGYRYGALAYRSLRFEHETREGDFQGVAVMNYTEQDTAFTRIIEHSHFEPKSRRGKTVITREYPHDYHPGGEAFYPVRDERNIALYDRYHRDASGTGVVFGGRLGEYQYFDMSHVVAQALAQADRELES